MKINGLRNILLIDDDVATNYFNEMIISGLNLDIKVEVALNGLEALQYISDMSTEGLDRAGIILLDLNMPQLNGWEFLERYHSFSDRIKNRFKVFILSSSTSIDDKDFALNHLDVEGYLLKPLNPEQLKKVIEEQYN